MRDGGDGGGGGGVLPPPPPPPPPVEPDPVLLVPGMSLHATLPAGDVDTLLFDAEVGYGVMLSIVDAGDDALSLVSLYRPDGSLAETRSGDSLVRWSFAASQTGTYRLVIENSSTDSPPNASYDVHFVMAPGANQGGLLSPGSVVNGALPVGGLESYTFKAKAGEGVMLRVAELNDGALIPGFTVYRPDGSSLDLAWGNRVASMAFSTPQEGTYTVVVYDASSSASRAGTFRLYYTLAPGANAGGVLTPGSVVSGEIALGELESFTFTATAGQGVHVRVADIASGVLIPGFTVYQPDGRALELTWGSTVATMAFSAPQDGIYTVVVYDAASSASGSGAFRLYYTLAPGANTGGALTPGGMKLGELELGELESFTFTAMAGQGVHLRVADITSSSLIPGFTVYGPNGSTVNVTWGNTVAVMTFLAPQDGTYTVAVYDAASSASGSGAFRLSYTLAPGANAGGALTPGGMKLGELELGELESFTFTASVGQGVHVRVADITSSSLIPGFTVYRPNGSAVGSTWGSTVAAMAFSAPQDGIYTVVVYDAADSASGTGAFRLSYTLAPGANAGGALTPGEAKSEQLVMGELKSFTISATAGQPLTVQVPSRSPRLFIPASRCIDPTELFWRRPLRACRRRTPSRRHRAAPIRW
jgi:large repetitive protein